MKALAVAESVGPEARERFLALHGIQPEGLQVDWEREPATMTSLLLGTARLRNGRVQPFALRLGSDAECLVLKCISPIGRVDPEGAMTAIAERATTRPVRIGAIVTRDERSYDLTVEEDVLLGVPGHDAARAGMLVNRVAERADTLEQIHLPTIDQPLEVFEADLEEEGSRGS